MDVDVQRVLGDRQPVDPGLLGRLAQRRRPQRLVPGLAVTAELLSAMEAAV